MSNLLWHSCAPWAPSGYGSQTGIWTQELVKAGHDVAISSYYGLSGAPTQWNGITVLPGYGHAYCSGSLFEHYKALQPDLVITLGDIWVLDPNLLRQMPSAHWLPSDCRPMSTADKNVVEGGQSQVIAMSRFGEARFRQAGFDPVYVPHGIDTDLFKPAEDKSATRALFGLKDDDYVIGVNAANSDAIRKAAPEMMLAFAKFLADCPEAVLALHTGVHQEGGQNLEVIAENLGITDRIRVVDQYRYHAGMVSAKEMADWYGVLDVLAGCTYGEGFGIPLIEAQACGVPVITTKASSMEELNPFGISLDGVPFFNGVHQGWWTRPSVPQMAQAFRDMHDMRNDVDREELREFVVQQYDISVVAEKYMLPAVDELLERMLSR